MAHPQANDNLSAQETEMNNLLKNIWKDTRGQDMTEYALIAGLLASVTCALVPEVTSVTGHIIVVLQSAAETAMHVAGLE
jgi:Flp pilus assembly pilin Flp